MESVSRYFSDKKQSYTFFFFQLLKVIDGLRRDCLNNIDQECNHILSQIRTTDSQQLQAIIQHLQSQRQLHFQSIVELLIRVLSNMPKNMVKNSSPIINRQALQHNIPPSPSQFALNKPTTPNRAVHLTGYNQGNHNYEVKSSNQKVPLILTASKNSSDRRSSSQSRNSGLVQNSPSITIPVFRNEDSNVKGYSINKMNPVIFELSSSQNSMNPTERYKQMEKNQHNKSQNRKMKQEMLDTSTNQQKKQIIKFQQLSKRKASQSSHQKEGESRKQQSLSVGISESNSSSLLKVMTLFKNDKEESPNYKLCQQLDNKIYAQANDYLNSCFTKKYNQLISGSRKNINKGAEESPIRRLKSSKDNHTIQTRDFAMELRE